MNRIIAAALGMALAWSIPAFAQVPTALISGTKFNDLNANGVWDVAEPGLPGVTIYLDVNNNETLDAGDMSTVTDANGDFSFAGLANGTFSVREMSQAGWTQTYPSASLSGEHAVVIAASSPVTDVDFGNTLTGNSSISGLKFNDINGNGVQDAGENGLSSVTIYLDANNDNTLNSGEVVTTTDSSGNYSFAGLVAGNYTVREVVQAGWLQTYPAVGLDMEHMISIGAASDITNINFANQLVAGGDPSVISGMKFNDENANGIHDASETGGVVGVIIYLDTNINGMHDIWEPYVMTGPGGVYSFDNLAAGTYYVREDMANIWLQTMPGASANNQHIVTLGAGATVTNIDFGNNEIPMSGNGIGGPGDVAGDQDGLPVTGLSWPVLSLILLLATAIVYQWSRVRRALVEAETER